MPVCIRKFSYCNCIHVHYVSVVKHITQSSNLYLIEYFWYRMDVLLYLLHPHHHCIVSFGEYRIPLFVCVATVFKIFSVKTKTMLQVHRTQYEQHLLFPGKCVTKLRKFLTTIYLNSVKKYAVHLCYA